MRIAPIVVGSIGVKKKRSQPWTAARPSRRRYSASAWRTSVMALPVQEGGRGCPAAGPTGLLQRAPAAAVELRRRRLAGARPFLGRARHVRAAGRGGGQGLVAALHGLDEVRLDGLPLPDRVEELGKLLGGQPQQEFPVGSRQA